VVQWSHSCQPSFRCYLYCSTHRNRLLSLYLPQPSRQSHRGRAPRRSSPVPWCAGHGSGVVSGWCAEAAGAAPGLEDVPPGTLEHRASSRTRCGLCSSRVISRHLYTHNELHKLFSLVSWHSTRIGIGDESFQELRKQLINS